MKILSLNGEYRMKSASGRFDCTAVIPGSDFGNLIKNGLIPDLLNEPDTDDIGRGIARESFSFEREFSVPGEYLAEKNAVLYCEKADCLCRIFINGVKAAESKNAHIPVKAETKSLLKAGKNSIRIEFDSPLDYVEKRQSQRHLPPNFNGVNGAQYLRKANCHFGWDWGPCVPYNYCGNIEIRFFEREISNIRITQKTTRELSLITVEAENADYCRLVSPGGEITESERPFNFEVKNPELWWSRDLSEKEKQPLYTVILGSGETEIKKRIGLRDIKLNTEKDKWGNNFQFVLNGEKVFAKGANVIPFAAIPEYADEKSVDYYIDLAAKSNFNILRVWGGGEYASEHFLNRCDELGILVWQDFMFACMMYPLDEQDFVESVAEEAKINIERETLHPCLALWCGNNEIEGCNPVTPKTSSLGKAYIDYFYSVLPKLTAERSDVPYIPTSPVGKAPFSGNSSEDSGDCHMWSVWHGLMPLDYYGTRYARFLSEFGMESLPSHKAINKFAGAEKSVFGPAFMHHQKCAGGNRKLMFYLGRRFGAEADFDLLPYLSGIMQAECIKAATEHFRRSKGRCNGSIFWQFNDVWNAPSWSAVDFEKVPKALMYKARGFFAPVTLSYAGGRVFVHNDTRKEKRIAAKFRVFSGSRLCRVFEKTVVSPAGSVTELAYIPLNEGEILRVAANGEDYTFDNVRALKKAELIITEGKNEITVITDVFTRNICIECDGIPEENYFTLLPGEGKTVKINGETGNYRVLCENNIEFSHGRIRNTAFRFFYHLKPENAVKSLWYKLH